MAWPRLQLLVGLGLVASKKYKYPGDDKGLECLSFRSEHREQLTLAEINHQFADDGELALWRTGQQFFARPKRNAKLVAGKYLDVGCGTGRVIMILGGLFESVTCVEADPARIDLARSNWYSGPWGKTSEMSFHNVRFGLEYISNASSYDAISCFHVVQHIPESILRTWLSKMYSMLKRSGVLVLATKHRRVDVLELSDGTRASPEKFNAMAFHSDDGRLAVRSFSQASLRRLLEEAGFVVWHQTYSTYELIDGTMAPDTQIIVAGKHSLKNMPPLPPITDIHVTPTLESMKIRTRRKCKRPCPGKEPGSTPADFIGC
jgi:2-polyprenyl-3-methyl-5-hydroxy-6-metoxy-1,4-benzoquinol methylase